MKSATLLRAGAIVLLFAACTTWVSTGAHRGWTRTELTEMKTDEITGLEYPVTRQGFVMGIELLVLASALSVALFGVGTFLARRPQRSSPLSNHA